MTYLEKSEVKQATAVVLMESVRDLIIQRKTMALKRMLDKEDMENVSLATVTASLLLCIGLTPSLARFMVN